MCINIIIDYYFCYVHSFSQCLNFYCSQWERVTYNFGKYSGSYATLLDEEEREALPHLTFERDQLEAEQMHKEEVC